MIEPEKLKLAYTIPQAAKATGLSRATLYRLANAKELELTRVYNRTLILREHIEAMLQRARNKELGESPRAAQA